MPRSTKIPVLEKEKGRIYLTFVLCHEKAKHTYIHTYTRIYIHTYICMHRCMRVRAHTHTHTHTHTVENAREHSPVLSRAHTLP